MRLNHHRTRKSAGCVALIFFIHSLGACSQSLSSESPKGVSEPIPASGTKVALTLVGYNYTNRSIGIFSVNGAGGGNLRVSTPTSGGGGSACCVTYVVGINPLRVFVRWQSDACTYNNEIYSNGERGYEIYRYFKEAEIDVNPSIPARPAYLEVHFYPDGHLEAAITAEDSAPRLKLNKAREDKTPYRKCPNDERPEE